MLAAFGDGRAGAPSGGAPFARGGCLPLWDFGAGTVGFGGAGAWAPCAAGALSALIQTVQSPRTIGTSKGTSIADPCTNRSPASVPLVDESTMRISAPPRSTWT